VLKQIRESADISDETDKALREAIEKFKQGFAVHDEQTLVTA
jgi:hypothetical protein